MTTKRVLMVFNAATLMEYVFTPALPSRRAGESDEQWVGRGAEALRERLHDAGRDFRTGAARRGDTTLRVVVTGGGGGITAERTLVLVGSLRVSSVS